MVAVTLMWATAGVVTRHLEQARSFEITFWRSFFTLAGAARDPAGLAGPGRVREDPRGRPRALDLRRLLVRDVHRLHGGAHADQRGQRAGDHGARRRSSPRLRRGSSSATGCRRAPGRRSWWPALGIAWMYGTAAGRRRCWPARWWRCACRWPAPATGPWCSMRHAQGARGRPGARGAGGRRDVLAAHAAAGLAAFRPTRTTSALLAFLGLFQLAIPCVLSVRLRRRAEGAGGGACWRCWR